MKQKRFEEKLAIFSIIAIPVLTILMALDKSPFKYTLSMLGNWFGIDDRIEFIIWGVLTAIFLAIFLRHLYKKTHFKNKKAKGFLYAATLFLIFTVFIPTLNRNPVPMALRHFRIGTHETFGGLFAISLVISLLLFTRYLSKHNIELSKETKIYWTITIGGSILALTIFGMTGIFELFFFISLSIFLLLLDRKILSEQKKKHSPARIRTGVPSSKGLYP